jgi:uncharacterized protein with PIN domain
MRFRIAPHLAFLVQWCRILGYDIRLWEKNSLLSPEGETLVQWDRYPIPSEEARIPRLTLSASSREALLREFIESSGTRPVLSGLFKRCLRCNSPLVPLAPDEALQKWPALPPFVYQTQRYFNWCEYCRQLFWAGTHVRNMIRTLQDWGIIIDPDL